MDPPPPDFRALSYSTSEAPPRQRLDIWRDLLWRKLIKVKVDPLKDVPFLADVEMRVLPDVRIGIGTIDPSIMRRSRDVVAADNDDVLMILNLDETFVLTQGRNELTLGPGDAGLVSCAELSTYVRAARGQAISVRLSRRILAPQVRDLDDMAAAQPVRNSGALHLLMNYARVLCKGGNTTQRLPTAGLRTLVQDHIRDLAALAIGPTADAIPHAVSGGLRAARLRAIKNDIEENLGRSDLSVVEIAQRHRITARHLHRLFESEGRTFSHYVLERRLQRAYHLLGDTRFAGGAISAIALLCGFGDISYFNRAFRRRFGATPSDVRQQGLN